MIFLDIFNTLLLCALSLECFRILQSCSYKPQRGYFKIFASRYFVLLAVAQVVVLLMFCLLPEWYVTIPLMISTVLTVATKRKCPLKFTKRILRMIVAQIAILFCLCYFVGNAYFVMVLPIVTLISWAICVPLETLIANYYLQKAVKKLSQSKVTVIAITGSYGKTCTKDMLAMLLDDSIAPKGSCNTPLGIATFINNTDLSAYKYLILEFGARNIGDINELCKLFRPKYGIITGICEQHLSTFKCLDNIIKTKGELVQNLPADGLCVFNGADENIKFVSQSGVCSKIFTSKKVVHNIQTTLQGTMLDIVSSDTAYALHLPQISSYIVDTFLMCFEMCIVLGQSVEKTVQNCNNVKPTPHRMEVSHNGNFWIVDDAYNANIKGVASCCETLAQFANYKIVLTQGIVEGGKRQQKLNEQCGSMLGASFDVVIAIGKYAKHIAVGASGGRCELIVAKGLTEGTNILQKYVKANCIVVFQNDLPDVVSL